ncbi:MAG: DUF2769 domain-containing protein [Actinobacteria bacterium]|nr:DUF2769 domain-containing protein [Actinomycetota bacterium]
MPVPNTVENKENCICLKCPTFSSCMSESKEGLFCATGKSGCEIEKQECICESCPIDREYQLTANLDLMEKMILKMNQFYCENGPAK